jgi:diaminopimelate decarboxylase
MLDYPNPIAGRPQFSQSDFGLCLEGIPLAPLAATYGTPCWVYGADTIRTRYRTLRDALKSAGVPAHIHYAVKANANRAILALLAQEGAGADVVSGGEIMRAEAADIAPGKIVFSGVGKSTAELEYALKIGVAQINVESAEELDQLSAIASRMGVTAKIVLRVNPDVDAGTHAKITTGLAENKFGIAMREAPALYRRAGSLPGIEPVGLATHIGSQITDIAPFRAAFTVLASLVRDLRAEGMDVSVLDCGGGVGIRYRDEVEITPDAYAACLRDTVGDLGCQLAIEPGRWIVGPAGVLLSQVILRKVTETRSFLVLDAAMNDLQRPAMYDSWHDIVPLLETSARPEPIDVVGPVCETGDCFARDRLLPALQPGDMVAMLDAGAYGSSI